MLFAGTRKLQTWWSTRVPAWGVETSAIAVERRWIANSLPAHELTDVLIHGYHRLLTPAQAVDAATGHDAKHAIDLPVSHLGSSMRRSFIKLSDGVEYKIGERALPAVTKALREKVKARYGAFDGRFLVSGKTLAERIEAWADLAAEVFIRDGYHQTMYVLLGADGNILRAGSVEFADRVDKCLFWNQMGEFARSDPDVCGVILVGEAWARQQDINAFDGNIGAVPIVGEILMVEGTNDEGDIYELTFDIVKTSGRPQVDRSNHCHHEAAATGFSIRSAAHGARGTRHNADIATTPEGPARCTTSPGPFPVILTEGRRPNRLSSSLPPLPHTGSHAERAHH